LRDETITAALRGALGDSYKPEEMDYVMVGPRTHANAVAKGYNEVGTVNLDGDSGTYNTIIMARRKPAPAPPPMTQEEAFASVLGGEYKPDEYEYTTCPRRDSHIGLLLSGGFRIVGDYPAHLSRVENVKILARPFVVPVAPPAPPAPVEDRTRPEHITGVDDVDDAAPRKFFGRKNKPSSKKEKK
jgi:hypothetical protein